MTVLHVTEPLERVEAQEAEAGEMINAAGSPAISIGGAGRRR